MGELFSTFGIDLELLLVQMINFGLVFLVLWYFLYRPVMNMIDKRQEKIEKGVKDAEKAEKELKNADVEKNAVLTYANEEAERIVSDGKRYAEEKKDEIMQEAQQKSEQTIAEARSRGEEAKTELLRESKEEVARMAVLGAERILRENASSEKTKATK